MEIETLWETNRANEGFGSTDCNVMSKGDLEQLVWSEQLMAHCGPWKVFQMLRRKGTLVPIRLVKRIYDECEIYAKFHQEYPRFEWQSVLYSEMPKEVMYADVIGLLPPGHGGVKYIHCIVDSVTRLAKASNLKTLYTKNIIKVFEYWM